MQNDYKETQTSYKEIKTRKTKDYFNKMLQNYQKTT